MAVKACKARFRASTLRADNFANANLERVPALVAPLDDFLARALCCLLGFGFFICVPFSDAVSHGVSSKFGDTKQFGAIRRFCRRIGTNFGAITCSGSQRQLQFRSVEELTAFLRY